MHRISWSISCRDQPSCLVSSRSPSLVSFSRHPFAHALWPSAPHSLTTCDHLLLSICSLFLSYPDSLSVAVKSVGEKVSENMHQPATKKKGADHMSGQKYHLNHAWAARGSHAAHVFSMSCRHFLDRHFLSQHLTDLIVISITSMQCATPTRVHQVLSSPRFCFRVKDLFSRRSAAGVQ